MKMSTSTFNILAKLPTSKIRQLLLALYIIRCKKKPDAKEIGGGGAWGGRRIVFSS